MEINDLLVPEGVVADLKATSKKQALQDLAKRAAEVSGLHERAIFDILMERERLGTTGVGNGIAIPHGKLASLDRLHGLFARLEQPIDFHAIDERPVDLIFVLLAPENAGADHLPMRNDTAAELISTTGASCSGSAGSSAIDPFFHNLHDAEKIFSTSS